MVHPLQISFLQHLLQTRITENVKSLLDPYSVLRKHINSEFKYKRRVYLILFNFIFFVDTFCLSLQLEVLYAQAIRLSRERLGDFIRVDEYIPCKRFNLYYWRDQNSSDPKSGCRLSIEIDNQDSSKPLQISHYPELGAKETEFANRAIKVSVTDLINN